MSKKAIKIYFEFEDDSVKSLEGSGARGWLEEISKLVREHPTVNWRKFKWDTITAEEARKKQLLFKEKEQELMQLAASLVDKEKEISSKAEVIEQKEKEESEKEKFPFDIFGE